MENQKDYTEKLTDIEEHILIPSTAYDPLSCQEWVLQEKGKN